MTNLSHTTQLVISNIEEDILMSRIKTVEKKVQDLLHGVEYRMLSRSELHETVKDLNETVKKITHRF